MSFYHSHPCADCAMYHHCDYPMGETEVICSAYAAAPQDFRCPECVRIAQQVPANAQEIENAKAEIREALRPIPGYRRSEMVARALEGVAHTTKCPDSQAYRSYQQFARQHGVPELLRVMADVLEAQR